MVLRWSGGWDGGCAFDPLVFLMSQTPTPAAKRKRSASLCTGAFRVAPIKMVLFGA